MVNRRRTEDIVKAHFKNAPVFAVTKLEEQKSCIKKNTDLLQNASKSGKGIGKPDFIISFPTQNTNHLIVVECKGNVNRHESMNRNSPRDFAVNGALHYGKILSEDFDVIALAVSGKNETELKISTFKWKKKDINHRDENTGKLLSINDYIKLFSNKAFSENLKNIDIIQKAVYLNDKFHSYSITKNSRCTIVSAILLALLDNTFKTKFCYI